MSLIRQQVRKNFRSNDVVMSAGDQAILIDLMEGVISVFDEKSSGGTDIATPATLRQMKFGVSRKADGLSGTVMLKHVKPTKHANDVFGHMAIFDADYSSALAATSINLLHQGAKA